MTSDDILKYARTLMMRIRFAHAYLNTYKAFCDNGKEYYEVMNQAPLFFALTEKSLVTALMIEVCKLFEDSSQVMSIKKLYNICEQNKPLFPKMRLENGKETNLPCNLEQILKTTNTKFESYSTIILNVKAQRDKLWAHTDKACVLEPDKIEKEFPVTWGDIEELLNFASGFANSIIICFTNSIEAHWFNSPNSYEENVLYVLNSMKSGSTG
ncbi:MAG: hypothetical protein Q4E35_05185 [Eubacteriales bacterium]|nr:hypothetical protein [Eubacteriales bacterium]